MRAEVCIICCMLCMISVQLLCKNLYDYSSILGERGYYVNGYMTPIETKDLQVCFMDVWIAFFMDRVCRVCVWMLVSVQYSTLSLCTAAAFQMRYYPWVSSHR